MCLLFSNHFSSFLFDVRRSRLVKLDNHIFHIMCFRGIQKENKFQIFVWSTFQIYETSFLYQKRTGIGKKLKFTGYASVFDNPNVRTQFVVIFVLQCNMFSVGVVCIPMGFRALLLTFFYQFWEIFVAKSNQNQREVIFTKKSVVQHPIAHSHSHTVDIIYIF